MVVFNTDRENVLEERTATGQRQRTRDHAISMHAALAGRNGRAVQSVAETTKGSNCARVDVPRNWSACVAALKRNRKVKRGTAHSCSPATITRPPTGPIGTLGGLAPINAEEAHVLDKEIASKTPYFALDRTKTMLCAAVMEVTQKVTSATLTHVPSGPLGEG